MKISARIIAIRANKSKSGRSFVLVTDGKMLVISETVFNKCVAGEINEVEFEANGEVTLADGTNMPSYAVKDYTDSAMGKLKLGQQLAAYAEGVDQAKVAAALALANTITL